MRYILNEISKKKFLNEISIEKVLMKFQFCFFLNEITIIYI